MEKLFEIQSIIFKGLEKMPYYPRQVLEEIPLDNHLTGITGQRGIGKTTYLLHQALKHGAENGKALYASADNIYFLEHKLIELVDTLYKETNIRLLCLDEIHRYSHWQQELKNIADTYHDFKILFSGSSMTDLISSKYDLSRRVTLHQLPGLSFREFLQFYYKKSLPLISLEALLNDPTALNKQLSYSDALIHFKRYLTVGYYPFFYKFSKDNDKFQAIVNSTQKTIFEDIALQNTLKTSSLLVIEKLFKYILQSTPGELNANKLAIALNKDHESVKNYLFFLEAAGLIRFLYTQKTGKPYLRLPEKIYPDNTNLIYSHYLPLLSDALRGKLRETFIINQLQNAKHHIYYPDNGDFACGHFTFEVGGKNKTTEQIKNQANAFVIADGILSATPKRIPLYYFGFLY